MTLSESITDYKIKKGVLMNNAVKEISSSLQKISGKYSYQIVFSDWVAMMAISISNACSLIHDSVWKSREGKYLDLSKRYTMDELVEMTRLFDLLITALDEKPSDYLGQIFMESGSGSQRTGQFFTPYHLSELTANIGMNDIPTDIDIVVNEPSCGGGGMIIAAASALKAKGVNYQQRMKVIAQDLDWTAIYMCYVQLSLLGIDAIVCQGNTLEKIIPANYDEEHKLYTPKNRGCIV